MAANPRISFVIDNNPTIIWPEVLTAKSYTIKMIRKDDPCHPVVELTVSKKDLVEEDKFLKFMYPSKATPLDPLVEYEFTGLTDDGKTASGSFIFLDSIRPRIDELLTKIKDTNVVTDPQVREKFISIVENILVARSGPPKPWLDGSSCFSIKFD